MRAQKSKLNAEMQSALEYQAGYDDGLGGHEKGVSRSLVYGAGYVDGQRAQRAAQKRKKAQEKDIKSRLKT